MFAYKPMGDLDQSIWDMVNGFTRDFMNIRDSYVLNICAKIKR